MTGAEFSARAQRVLDAFVERVVQELAELAARLVDRTFAAPAARAMNRRARRRNTSPPRAHRAAGRRTESLSAIGQGAGSTPAAGTTTLDVEQLDDEPCRLCRGRCDVAAAPVAAVAPVVSSTWVPAQADGWREVRR